MYWGGGRVKTEKKRYAHVNDTLNVYITMVLVSFKDKERMCEQTNERSKLEEIQINWMNVKKNTIRNNVNA